jgi:hypothetical protein
MHIGCEVYMNSFLHGIKCLKFHGHLDYLKKKHVLDVVLTQNWETMALRNLTIIGLLKFIMCEDPA